MEETDIRPHAGIPLGHKFLAVLLAVAAAAAGSAWLIEQSRKSASTAVLAFSLSAAQRVDAGISSARSPAVALADSMLSGQAIAKLAKQANLAASTSAGQIGEFRSDLQLTQPSAVRLAIRFRTANSSQSMAAANAVAHALADSSSTPGTPAPAAQPAAAAPAAAPTSESANQGQSNPSDAQAAGSGLVPTKPSVPDHPLSEDLQQLGAQLSAANQQIDHLGAEGVSSTGREQPSYIESSEQSLLRIRVRKAQQTLIGLRTRHAKELADPNISARVVEIQQALGSILNGGRRNGFNAAGVSTAELGAERSELRQAIRIVNEETKRVEAAEAANPVSSTQSTAPAAAPSTQTAESSSTPPSSSSSGVGQSAVSGVQEQNIPATPPAGHAAQPSSENLFNIVHLAAPTARPPLWPAIAAGALCGFLYFGIAALAYRSAGSDEDDSEISSAPQRMITVADPIRIQESAAPEPEPPPLETAPRHRASFVFQPEPRGNAAGSVKNPTAPTEEPLAAVANPAGSAESTAADAQGGGLVLAGEADLSADDVAGTDPVADRIRKSLANTSVAKMLETPDRADAEHAPPGAREESESCDPLSDSVTSSGE